MAPLHFLQSVEIQSDGMGRLGVSQGKEGLQGSGEGLRGPSPAQHPSPWTLACGKGRAGASTESREHNLGPQVLLTLLFTTPSCTSPPCGPRVPHPGKTATVRMISKIKGEKEKELQKL